MRRRPGPARFRSVGYLQWRRFSTLDALRSAVLHQRERCTLSELRVMVHPGAREFLRNIGAEACFGFQPVIAVVSVQRTVLNIEMIGIIANLVIGRLRCGRGRVPG